MKKEWESTPRISYPSIEQSHRCRDADAHIERLTTRVAELEKDAARYRWLRENNIVAHVKFEFADGCSYVYAEDLDAAIDAAMKGGEA